MRFSELMRRIGEHVEVGVVRTWDGKADPEILRVCEDSRQVRPGDLFVARGGTKTDGEKFIADALKQGAVAVVGEMRLDNEGTASAEVKDANLALALLAHEIAGNPTRGMKMIGVTGTKGKTTVAYLMRSVLKAAGKKVGMIGTVEIDDGVAVVPAEMTTPGVVQLVQMFARMRANEVTHCVMEVSSHALHQQRTAGLDFAVAIFTNLTGDHLDYHKTMEEYAAAKALLFAGLSPEAVGVVNADDPWADEITRKTRGRLAKYSLTGRKDAAWTGQIEAMTSERMEMTIGHGRGLEHLHTLLVGRHNAYNLLSVIAAAQALGVAAGQSVQLLREERGAPGRLQRVEGATEFSVFVDYAHTHDALENVLTALRTTMGKGHQRRDREGAVGVGAGAEPLPDGRGSDDVPRLICVFGCGGDRDRTKRPKMGAIAARLADRVIVTSDNPRTENAAAIIDEICAGFSEGWNVSEKIVVEPDRRAAINKAIGMAQANDVVLIAGKGHENYQIIGATKHHFDDVEVATEALKAHPLRGVGTMDVPI